MRGSSVINKHTKERNGKVKNMMKRLLAGLLTASLTASFCTGTASAADVPTEKPVHFYVEEVTAYPGDQNVAIRVVGEQTEKVKSGGLQVYHAAELKPVFAENGEVKCVIATNKTTYESSDMYNPKYNLIALLVDSGLVSVTYYFDIPQGIKPGIYPVTVNVDSLVDKNAASLDSTTDNGYIEVLSNLRGDVNCDGIVTNDDAELAMKEYTTLSANKSSILSEQAKKNGDVDGDGRVSASDASWILHYVKYGKFPDEEEEETTQQTGETTTDNTQKSSSAQTNTTAKTEEPEKSVLYGDVNCDGKVEHNDE